MIGRNCEIDYLVSRELGDPGGGSRSQMLLFVQLAEEASLETRHVCLKAMNLWVKDNYCLEIQVLESS